MPRWISLSRATTQIVAYSLGAALLSPALALASGHAGLAAGHAGKSVGGGESTPLNLTTTSTKTSTGSSGGDLVRTIVGLAIVIAVIWGISWALRQVKNGRSSKAEGAGLASLATLPLGSGRSMQLVRAGNDYVLVGVGEHGVVPIHRYTEQQARDAGLLRLEGNPMLADDTRSGVPIQIPGSGHRQDTLIDKLRRWTVRT